MSLLRHKVLAGIFSTGASKAVLAAAGLLITTILANKLAPKDFGLVGMATVFTAFLSMLGGLGFDSAIIQNRTLSQRQLSTLFWIRLAIGILIGGLLAASAPLIAAFYREPRLSPVLQALSFIFVSSSLYQVHRTSLRKELRFGAIAVNTVTSVLASGALGITLAFLGFGVWSLVLQSISMDLISALLFLRAHPWKPHLTIAWKETAPVVRFGITMASGSLILYLQRNIDSLMVGRLLGAVALGYYSLAYRIMYAPVRQISYIFTDVLFPSLSSIQNDRQLLARNYTRCVKVIALLTFPLMTFVTLFSHEIVDTLFGQQWTEAGTVIGILAPAGALQSVTQIAYVIFPVLGRPKLSVAQYSIGCLLIALGVALGSRWGVEGTAWGVLCAGLASCLIAITLVHRLLSIPPSEVVHTYRSALAISAALVALSSLVHTLLPSTGTASRWILAAQGTVGLLLYSALLLLLERKEINSLRDVLGRSLSKKLRPKPQP